MPSMTSEIATDLLTPLGAYLRLRDGGRAAFLLESVERGRLGRHSFVGSGSRLVGFDEAETLGEPVVGYLGYDMVARLEPTVPLPEQGPGFDESRFVVPELLVRFDHARGVAEVSSATKTKRGACSKGRSRTRRAAQAAAESCSATPTATSTSAGSSSQKRISARVTYSRS